MTEWSRREFVKLLPGLGVAAPAFPQKIEPPSAFSTSVRIEGHKIFITTPNMEVDLVGLGIARVRNRRTGRDHLNLTPSVHLILSDNSHPGEARNGLLGEESLESVRQVSREEVIVEYEPLSSGLPGAKVSGKIRVTTPESSLIIQASVELKEPGLSAVIHPLWGLDNKHELLLPVFGGTRFRGKDYAQLFFDPSTRESITAKPKRLSKALFPWPNALSGCFLIYVVGQEGFWLHTSPSDLSFKIISFEQTDQYFNASMWSSVPGRPGDCSRFTGAAWTLETFQDGWERQLGDYVMLLKSDSPAWRYRKNPIAWVQDVRLILNSFAVVEHDRDGNAKDSPELLEKNLILLKKLSQVLSPSKIVIYPFHWQLIRMEYGSGVGYPDWTPSPGFAKLSREARKLGYRIMPHLNFFAISPKNAKYAEFEPFILRNPVDGKKMGWLLDEQKEEGMAYVHPAAPGWFELQLRLVKEMLAAMPADAIFWDQTLNMLNAANLTVAGKTTIEGTIEFLRRMREAFPDIAFGGEGVTEITVPYQDFVQVHTPGIYALSQFDPDKAADFHWGLNQETFAMRAPMMKLLYSDRVRLIGHAAEPDTQSPSFGDWLQLTEQYGLVTSVTGLSNQDLDSVDGPVRRLLATL